MQVVLSGRSYFRLPDTRHHATVIVLSPSVADSQSVSDHGPDSSPHLSHFRQRGDRRGCKVAREPLWRLSGSGSGGSGIGESGAGRSGAGRRAGVRGRYCHYDPMALDCNDAVSDLGQSFNIDVRAAIDLSDYRSGILPIHDEDFIFSRCALREEDSRERYNKSQRQEESKIAMFVHHVRFTSISVLTSEASNIIQCAEPGDREPGDRREVSLTLKSPVIMSQMSLVKQTSENVPSVPKFRPQVPQVPVAWRCLSLCRDAEAMRIAVIVGKDKLGLPIVSRFEF